MENRVTIRLMGLADGSSTEFDGQYLVEYDPSRDGVSPSGEPMTARVITTPDIAKAKRYTPTEAFAEWKRSYGIRPDGEPNRPLTAFNVEIG